MARRRRYRPPYRRRRRGIPVGRYVILFLALATAIWWMLPDSGEYTLSLHDALPI